MDILTKLLEHLKQELGYCQFGGNPYAPPNEYDYKLEGQAEAYERMIEWVKDEMKEAGNNG